jgi:NAD(P)-dependent dehydrogenase (short-subunit alcohol dehydrogenase family)
MSNLMGKVAVITGAAGGIGRAVASQFVISSARVHLVDLHEAPLKALVRSLGSHASYSVADVSSERDTLRYVADAMEQHGRIDTAFLNAGIVGAVSPISDTSVSMYDKVMSVNVRGV